MDGDDGRIIVPGETCLLVTEITNPWDDMVLILLLVTPWAWLFEPWIMVLG